MVRVTDLAKAEELTTLDARVETQLEGNGGTVFRNGGLAYVVTNVSKPAACPANYYGATDPGISGKTGATPTCYQYTQRVNVVEVATGKLVGSTNLPWLDNNYYGGWGWYGCYYYDWYYGSDVVQVEGDALVFRRWLPNYSANGTYDSARQALFVVDIKAPAEPKVASLTIISDSDAWWGNLRVAGNQLYVAHEEWGVEGRLGQHSWDRLGRNLQRGCNLRHRCCWCQWHHGYLHSAHCPLLPRRHRPIRPRESEGGPQDQRPWHAGGRLCHRSQPYLHHRLAMERHHLHQ